MRHQGIISSDVLLPRVYMPPPGAPFVYGLGICPLPTCDWLRQRRDRTTQRRATTPRNNSAHNPCNVTQPPWCRAD
eukprot:9072100-Pyramimonas_sp.AAC.1